MKCTYKTVIKSTCTVIFYLAYLSCLIVTTNCVLLLLFISNR